MEENHTLVHKGLRLGMLMYLILEQYSQLWMIKKRIEGIKVTRDIKSHPHLILSNLFH